MLLITACASNPYYERHTIKRLNVVFTDLETINRLYCQKSHLACKKPKGVVLGFYDPNTNTIYAEQFDFEVIGHELTHAIAEYRYFHR